MQHKRSQIEQPLKGAKTASPAARGSARTITELNAVVADTERATQTVLAHLEAIERALRDCQDAASAHAVAGHVTAIYEACHFQDLIGQRIANALAAMERRTRNGKPVPRRNALINGPKLDGDSGHATQNEIDRLFG